MGEGAIGQGTIGGGGRAKNQWVKEEQGKKPVEVEKVQERKQGRISLQEVKQHKLPAGVRATGRGGK